MATFGGKLIPGTFAPACGSLVKKATNKKGGKMSTNVIYLVMARHKFYLNWTGALPGKHSSVFLFLKIFEEEGHNDHPVPVEFAKKRTQKIIAMFRRKSRVLDQVLGNSSPSAINGISSDCSRSSGKSCNKPPSTGIVPKRWRRKKYLN